MKKYILKTSDQKEIIVKDRLVFDFYKTMIENDYDYEYLNYNIRSLKISPIRFPKIKSRKENTIAYYDCKKNEIKYVKGKKEKSLPHELMHMASTVRNKDKSIFSGFSQKTKDGNFLLIGSRFNEGYTQLLTERYFSDIVNKAYPLEMLIAFQVEEILEKTKMEKMYFEADLLSLITELSKYKAENEVMYFICSMDIFENIYTKSGLINNFSLIKDTYLNIIDFLTSIKIEKLKEQNYDRDKIKEIIKEYIDTFVIFLNIRGENAICEIVNEEMLKNIYDKYEKELDSYYKEKTYSK